MSASEHCFVQWCVGGKTIDCVNLDGRFGNSQLASNHGNTFSFPQLVHNLDLLLRVVVVTVESIEVNFLPEKVSMVLVPPFSRRKSSEGTYKNDTASETFF